MQHRRARVAGSGGVADVHVRPAQLLVRASVGAPCPVRVDQQGLTQGAEAVRVLLDHHHHEAVPEPDRAPDPVEPLGPLLLGGAAGLLAGDRADAPTAVAGAGPALRGDRVLDPGGANGAARSSGLDEAAALQREPVPGPGHVVRLPDGGELALPGQVEAEPVGIVRGGLADQPEGRQRLHHLDPDRPDPQLHPVVAERVRGPHRVQPVPRAQGGVGVDHAGVGVDAEAGDQQRPALVVEDVEDAAVVGVAVTGGDMAHGQRHLVHGVLVERDGTLVRRHGLWPPCGSMSSDGTSETCGGAIARQAAVSARSYWPCRPAPASP